LVNWTLFILLAPWALLVENHLPEARLLVWAMAVVVMLVRHLPYQSVALEAIHRQDRPYLAWHRPEFRLEAQVLVAHQPVPAALVFRPHRQENEERLVTFAIKRPPLF
jgi:hypothetical protein